MEAITSPTCRHLVPIILQCHPGQQLYLLGSTEIKQRTRTVFREDHPGCVYTGHWFLLALVALRQAQDDKLRQGFDKLSLTTAEDDMASTNAHGPAGLRQGFDKLNLTTAQPDILHFDRLSAGSARCDMLQDKIENTLAAQGISATVLVIPVTQFTRWVAEGNPFACTIIRKATLLHDNGYIIDTGLPVTPARPTKDDITRTAAFHRRMAKQFFDGAMFYRQKGSNDLAAFMLHQCAEQCLRCLLKITTGYCVHTHNIDKLVRYCSMTVHKLTEIFHNRTPEQARLYRLLRNAYIDARYNTYIVMDDDMGKLMGKVRALMKLLNEYAGAYRGW